MAQTFQFLVSYLKQEGDSMEKIKNKIVFIVIHLMIFYLIVMSRTLIAQPELNIALAKKIEFPGEVRQTILDFADPLNPRTKVQVYDKRIEFYDEEGKVITTREYENPIYVEASENNEFLQVLRYPTPATKSNMIGTKTIDILDNKGTALWSKEYISYYEGRTTHIVLSNTGKAVEVHVHEGKLVFLDRNGTTRKEVYIPAIKETQGESAEIFSNDADRFIIGISTNRYLIGKGIEARIIVFTDWGEEVWRYVVEESNIRSIFLSPDSRYLLCTSVSHPLQDKENRSIYLLNLQNGELILSEKGVYAEQAMFFEKNGNYHAVINDLSERLVYVDLSLQRMEVKYEVSTNRKILGICADANRERVALIESEFGYEAMPERGQKVTLSNHQVKIYDLKGSLLSKGVLPVHDIGVLYRGNYMKLMNNLLTIYQRKPARVMVFDVNPED